MICVADGSFPPEKLLLRLCSSILPGVAVTAVLAFMKALPFVQAAAIGIMVFAILATALFHKRRLAVAAAALAALACVGALNPYRPTAAVTSGLEMLFFLFGLMIVTALLRDLGFFTWIAQGILSMPRLSGRKFAIALILTAAIQSAFLNEIAATFFVAVLVLQVCERLQLRPGAWLMTAVMAANIGSAGTIIGNPAGICIAGFSDFGFFDFFGWTFPLMLLVLAFFVLLVMLVFRRDFDEFDRRLTEFRSLGLRLTPEMKLPWFSGACLLGAVLLPMLFHAPLERWFDASPNTVLLFAPLGFAGVILFLRPECAARYLEREMPWRTFLFFLLLFSMASAVADSGLSERITRAIGREYGGSHAALVPVLLLSGALGSALYNNVAATTVIAPLVSGLGSTVKDLPLWLALLFGGCFGSNLVVTGGAANLIANVMLEKRTRTKIGFFRWLPVGAAITLFGLLAAWGGILLCEPFMPDRPALVTIEDVLDSRISAGKTVAVKGVFRSGGLCDIRDPMRRLSLRCTEEFYAANGKLFSRAALGEHLFSGKVGMESGLFYLKVTGITKVPRNR